MPGYRFWLRSAFPGWGSWCLCVGFGLSCTPLFLVWVLGRVASCAAACSGLWPLGLRPPFPFRLGCVFVCFFSFARHFSGGGCVGVSGVSFPLLGCCPRLGVARFGRLVLQCSFGGSRGCRLWCCLAAGFARLFWSECAASRLCVCLLSPLISLCPRARVFGLAGSPPLLCFLFLPFFGGGFACSSLCLPWAGARTVRHSVWLTGLLLVLRLAGLCPGPMGLVGYVHAWPGGLSCRVRYWLCRLVSCTRRFREVLG